MGKKEVEPPPEPKNKLFLAFGPEEAFFFSSPSYQRWSEDVPAAFKELLPDADPNKPEPTPQPLEEHSFFSSMKSHMSHKKDEPVAPRPYRVSFGDNGSWVLIWDNGEHGAYPELLLWLRENRSTLGDGSLNVSLGPDGAFYAWTQASCRWANVPGAFHAYMQKMLTGDGWKRRPKFVAFGINSSFVIVCDDGDWFPNLLEENYPGLTEQLTQAGKVKAIALSPYSGQSYFLITETGNVHWKVPDTWSNLVEETSNQYIGLNRRRSPSLPLESMTTSSSSSTRGKKVTSVGEVRTWNATNAALQAGQLIVSSDQACHQQ